MSKEKDSHIVKFTSFSSDRIKRLSSNNFTLDDKMMIGLKYDDCIIILFHVQNEESNNLMRIWYLVAEQTAGPIFASCNVLLEDQVAQAFARVKMNGSHPLNPYALHQWPVIIVYRKGFPSAVYNGEPNVQSIAEWSLLLACRANYFEPIQIFAGINVDENQSIKAPIPYPEGENNPEAKVSSDFKINKSKRGRNKQEEKTEEKTTVEEEQDENRAIEPE